MKKIKQLIWIIRVLLFAFMLAVCMVLGIAPVIPKRKEEISIETKIKETEKPELTTGNIKL